MPKPDLETTLRECLEASQIHLAALLTLETDDEQAPIIGDVIQGLTISIDKAQRALKGSRQ